MNTNINKYINNHIIDQHHNKTAPLHLPRDPDDKTDKKKLANKSETFRALLQDEAPLKKTTGKEKETVQTNPDNMDYEQTELKIRNTPSTYHNNLHIKEHIKEHASDESGPSILIDPALLLKFQQPNINPTDNDTSRTLTLGHQKLLDLIARQVNKAYSNKIITDGKSKQVETTQMLIKLSNASLPDTSLLITQQKSGTWLLKTTSAQYHTINLIKHFAPKLIDRFNKNGLGKLKVKTTINDSAH
ncbi:MAG: hypothetical protein JKY67_20645 [Pseudomonadales bacterium]|nr:hypothetical protein [Pseudomonadales bacterium]